ncbi:hypothetical protein GRF59_19170 [Paenibacillus sp. HJL G12]|uniref:SWIM-type domain-containing protein n=1 Tax=Paenibacillus dendrobii TaxID=2691084 RepID=A0A7X3LJ01_9BACL|nr:hypothetical protein [Paenibacillus dendrobii]MWV45740.1 hypothetical protein [Paenibacillus dendrobii]
MLKKNEPYELSIVPGWIHAKEAQSQKSDSGPGIAEAGWKVDIPYPLLTMDGQVEIGERFAGHPYALYALLKNEAPSWLDGLLPDGASLPEQAVCSCGTDGCGHIQAVMEAAEQKLRSEPLLRLVLRGLTRENLLNHVFREWAEEVPPAAETADGEALSKLEEKGKAGPSSGEWLAEAAEQGKLHEPGAAYREVSVSPKAVPEDELEIDDWTELLPKVKAVQQVVRQITLEAAGKARDRLNMTKDS